MSQSMIYRRFFEETDEDNPKYWGKEAAGCIFLARDTGRILLARRSNEVSYEPNTWAGWGGKLDDNETPLQAAEREVEEETGFRGNYKVNHLWTFNDPETGFRYHNYLVVVPKEFTPRLNWENDDYEWVEFGSWPRPLHWGIELLLQNSGETLKKVVDLIKRKRNNPGELKEAAMDVPPQPPAIVQSAQQISPSFGAYMKSVENGGKKGYNPTKKLWFPHESPEGGLPTIAYGHKIENNAELARMNKGITDSEAERLLKNDIEDAWEKVKKDLHTITRGVTIPLSGEQKEMFIDYAFNLGTIKGFPEFVKAVLNKDWNKAKKEYVRTYKDKSGVKHQLARNKVFFDRYLANKETPKALASAK